MAGIARVGIDQAGGVIKGGGQAIARINGAPMAVVGDEVVSHGNGPHQGPAMVQGSGILRVNGIPVVLAGMVASCGHQASGSPTCGVSG